MIIIIIMIMIMMMMMMMMMLLLLVAVKKGGINFEKTLACSTRSKLVLFLLFVIHINMNQFGTLSKRTPPSLLLPKR